MSEITVQEFVKVYGDNSVTFSSYYKYSFCYSGDLSDGSTICVFCGDDADSIYRLQVYARENKTIKELYLDIGLSAGYVTNSDGKEVVSFEGRW